VGQSCEIFVETLWTGSRREIENLLTDLLRYLIIGKKATFIIATGGIYDAETQMASFNFVEPYLRSVFGFLGVTDATFLTAGGTSALNQGKDRNTFLAPHLQAVQTHAQTF
jgi:FMN-dependent NADH-azoreductase